MGVKQCLPNLMVECEADKDVTRAASVLVSYELSKSDTNTHTQSINGLLSPTLNTALNFSPELQAK